jgi:hypothetical protein
MVKLTVVHAMSKQSMYRRRRALEPLHKIVASKSIKKNSPGLCKNAQQVIDMIEKECPE